MRKTSIALASVLTLAAISFTPIAAVASPAGLNLDVRCPGTSGAMVVTNFGDYVAGYGQETVGNSSNNPIYFKSTSLPNGVPGKLTNYRNETVDYDSRTGEVVCNYRSAMPNESAFAVSYILTNGKGGNVIGQSNDYIIVSLPVGFRA